MFNTILFPVDRGQEARQAADAAIDLVKKYQARLIVLSVLDEEEGGDRATHASLLERAKDIFAEAGITVETRLEVGKPAFAICDVADELNVDLIVMGSRGISLTDEHPEKSVSQRVIALSPCPVLIVP